MPFFFTTTYLFHFSQILGFCGYRISTLLPPPGSRLFQKCSFSAFFTPNSLQKNKLGVCGSVEMRTHCFLNFCSRFWFIASLSDIVPGHPHVPCTVLDLVICSFVHETNNVMFNKNSENIAATSILNWFWKVYASLALSTGWLVLSQLLCCSTPSSTLSCPAGEGWCLILFISCPITCKSCGKRNISLRWHWTEYLLGYSIWCYIWENLALMSLKA